MGEGSFVEGYNDGRVVPVAKRVEIRDDSPHKLRIAVDGVEDIFLLHHIRIDQRRLDDVSRPCFIASGVEGPGIFDVVHEADYLDVFVVGLYLMVEEVGLRHDGRLLGALIALLVNLRLDAVATGRKLGSGGHDGEIMA